MSGFRGGFCQGGSGCDENCGSRAGDLPGNRFAPMLSVTENLSAREIIEGALKGLSMGKKQYGMDGNLILCGMRHMPVEVNTRAGGNCGRVLWLWSLRCGFGRG